MTDRKSRKILVRRPTRVSTDSHGRSVWADPAESAELELVSTQMLKVMLTSKSKADIEAIGLAAAGGEDGVLVRHPGSGSFEIISDEELDEILAANEDLPKISKPADATLEPLKDYADDEKLSLVSSRALRRVLDDGQDAAADKERERFESVGGFNPYDNA